MTATELALAEFIRQLGNPGGGGALLAADQSLLESGMLDSLGLQQLVQHIETGHGVTLGEDHFSAENFETIGALARLIDQLRAGAA
ncbi:MAG: hypothetical protein RL026_1555 [Pseudomonadota bacterium]|jgi:acyl carrier protein